MSRRHLLPPAALLCAGVLATPTAAAVPPAPAPTRPLRIPLTNDDGYDAPGIRGLYDRLSPAGYDVTIVAPLNRPERRNPALQRTDRSAYGSRGRRCGRPTVHRRTR
ncbi:5'/3'-nucleotidase SurE [Streptomyces roseochromogenus]|uniref:5'-nucleotidase n=1 Tax=Streptomyces roseochromogenus subsp. oscitans DS 12.976 TaxID=1352936 RepID=V6JIH3_STRRC|nr:5'/3'-nucleotidase SurE [Streptomyces roseochromogenus]EST19523.1 hypothetical protein M878_42010 [Streptomyces roseochromogenus subsp. oscitans DS 12.976]